MKARLDALPLSLTEANALVAQHHRYHKPVQGHKFSIAAALEGRVVGVAIVGRPCRGIATTLEVTRLCTDGTRNACSFLYGRAARAAFALGYQRLGTYTTLEEGVASLRASGWRLIASTPGRSWSVKSRPRVDLHPLGQKLLWEIESP